MEKNNQDSSSKRIKIQRVKNYDSEDINSKTSKVDYSQKSGHTHNKRAAKISSSKNIDDTQKVSAWTKIVIGITYIFGLSSLLYFLSSAWIFLGTISIAFSLTIFLLAKRSITKESSGKVFFVSLCGTVVSMLFWVLFLVTRRYGIGFLSSLFRAIQIAGAILSALLILYYFVEFVSGGKFKINWLESITEKTEQKLSHKGAKN